MGLYTYICAQSLAYTQAQSSTYPCLYTGIVRVYLAYVRALLDRAHAPY